MLCPCIFFATYQSWTIKAGGGNVEVTVSLDLNITFIIVESLYQNSLHMSTISKYTTVGQLSAPTNINTFIHIAMSPSTSLFLNNKFSKNAPTYQLTYPWFEHLCKPHKACMNINIKIATSPINLSKVVIIHRAISSISQHTNLMPIWKITPKISFSITIHR